MLSLLFTKESNEGATHSPSIRHGPALANLLKFEKLSAIAKKVECVY